MTADAKCHVRSSAPDEPVLMQARSQGVIKKSPSEILQVLFDKVQRAQYDEMFQTSEVLETFSIFQIVYIKNKGKLLVEGRDFVCITGRIDYKNYTLSLTTSIEYPAKPPQPKSTRGALELVGWKFEKLNDQETDCTMVMMADPKGSIPQMIFKTAAKTNSQLVIKVREHMYKKK